MENNKNIIKLLAKFPSFEQALIDEIVIKGSIEHIPAGNVIMEPGKYIKFIPLLCEGIIEIYRNDTDYKEVLLYYLKEGEACSAMISCCMANQISYINARTIEDTIIIKIPIQNFDIFLHTYPSWKNFIFNQYRLRFNELLETIDSLAFYKMDERLIRYFKNIYKTTNKTIFEGSHSDIAQALSTSREVVSRLLKALENQEKVKLYRNKIDFNSIIINE